MELRGRPCGRPVFSAIFLLLLLFGNRLFAQDVVPAREYLLDLQNPDSTVIQDILPTWQVGSRRVFCLDDLLRLCRLDHSRNNSRLELYHDKHSLRAEARKTFVLLDGTLQPLAFPVILTEDGLLAELPLIDKLLESGLLVGSADHTEESLVLKRYRAALGLENLQGGQVLRLMLDSIPAYETNHSGRVWTLQSDAASPLGRLFRDRKYSQDQSDLVQSLKAQNGRLQLKLHGKTELVDIVEVPALGELQFVLAREGGKLSEEFQPRESPKLVRPQGKPIDLDVIVIDAGHGGKDPGALSRKGSKEKTVVLALARELKKELKRRLPGVKIVMTRDSDTFLKLGERTRMANREGGKLFISLHANAARNRSARGWEVFFLRPGKNRHAREVALRENAVIEFEENSSGEYTVQNWILATMAQSVYVEESQNLAALIAQNMKPIGYQRKRPVNQQGFFVLVGASMPSVLFECGFITNKQDEKLITSKNGQQRIAKALAESVLAFQDLYRENGHNGGN